MVDIFTQNKQSDEVYHAGDEKISLSNCDTQKLIDLARSNTRQRVRLCVHQSASELVQQMLIVHPGDAYVRPHMHKKKIESMLVLEGDVDYVTFDGFGAVVDVVQMSDYRSGKPFYKSIGPDTFHTIVIRSKWLVFLEVTKGPFVEGDTVFSDWSPIDAEVSDGHNYIENILRDYRK